MRWQSLGDIDLDQRSLRRGFTAPATRVADEIFAQRNADKGDA
jgi:hypothetical protein